MPRVKNHAADTHNPTGEGRSMLPRVLGLAMVVLALVGLAQSLPALVSGPDFEVTLLLGHRADAWHRFQFWNGLTAVGVSALHLAAGLAATLAHRRAPTLASVYAGATVLRVGAVLLLYQNTLAPVLRPLSNAPLFRGYDAGLLLQGALLLCWAALVAVGLNLRRNKARQSPLPITP